MLFGKCHYSLVLELMSHCLCHLIISCLKADNSHVFSKVYVHDMRYSILLMLMSNHVCYLSENLHPTHNVAEFDAYKQ